MRIKIKRCRKQEFKRRDDYFGKISRKKNSIKKNSRNEKFKK